MNARLWKRKRQRSDILMLLGVVQRRERGGVDHQKIGKHLLRGRIDIMILCVVI